MSINFINDFQKKIYELLRYQPEISNKIDKIYLSVPQDAKYPFLLISITRLADISKFYQPIYEVDFEIKAFARDRNHNLLISITNEISDALLKQLPHFNDYIVAGMKLMEVELNQSTDLVTNKLTMQYKALLKKGLNI